VETPIRTSLTNNSSIKGGSLFNTFAKTAYTLAPTAALLATAALIIKPRKSHTNRHNKRHNKRRTKKHK
jgi:hypothetical protein